MYHNRITKADAYTISSNDFASKEARAYSAYNFVNRYSPEKAFPDLAFDSRMVLAGLHDAIDKVATQITDEQVMLAEKFMSRAHSFGGHLNFPIHLWKRVVKEYNGYLPLKITAIPEGSTFFPNEPVIQVESTAADMGELAAHVEARLVGMVSIATAAATLCRHWLERMREQVRTDYILLYGKEPTAEEVDNNARFQIHNFGARACDTDDESILIGKAHLLSFYGTDNFDAAYDAWMNGASDPIGTSILALAHRNIQGHKMEVDGFQAIVDATKGQSVRIASFVADCYNYKNAVKQLVAMAHHNPDVIFVIRPDSGDCYDTLKFIYDTCIEMGVYKEVNGFKVPKNVRFIYGDSVKPAMQFFTMNKLRVNGMLPTQWGIWGVGGYIRNTPNRDSLSSAYKLCAVYGNKPVVKLSETKTKLSVPFVNHIFRYIDKNDTKVTVVPRHVGFSGPHQTFRIDSTIYHDGIVNTKRHVRNFDTLSNRAIKQFDEYSDFARNNPNFGLGRECLHESIIAVQNETYAQYKEDYDK